MALRLLLPPSVGSARARARAELLDQSLRAALAEPMSIAVADSYADLAQQVEREEAHLVWMPPTVAARLEPILRSVFKCVRHGQTTYRSSIVARRRAFGSIDDLAGARAAWVDPLSVGGHLLARSALRENGVFARIGEQRFHGDYPSALGAVLDGQADFAAITVRDDSPAALRDSLASFGGRPAADRLAGLHATHPSPNDAIGVTAALHARAADRIVQRVFRDRRARAQAALCLALDAEGFVRAEPDEYAPLRRLIKDA